MLANTICVSTLIAATAGITLIAKRVALITRCSGNSGFNSLRIGQISMYFWPSFRLCTMPTLLFISTSSLLFAQPTEI
ncbi:Uncharacterised protein [Vibrio cholerae]|nr:Uncharacterised protein [Vibrio cholerae]